LYAMEVRCMEENWWTCERRVNGSFSTHCSLCLKQWPTCRYAITSETSKLSATEIYSARMFFFCTSIHILVYVASSYLNKG